MREDATYTYGMLDYFQDMNQIVDMNNFSADDFYYFEETEEEIFALLTLT